MGEKGTDVLRETQFLLVESKGTGDEDAAYVMFPPTRRGRVSAFQASLYGGAGDTLELCVESGDADMRAPSFERALFRGTAGSGAVVATAKSAVQTFWIHDEKMLWGIVDYFGSSVGALGSWDAFYQDVTQEGVEGSRRGSAACSLIPCSAAQVHHHRLGLAVRWHRQVLHRRICRRGQAAPPVSSLTGIK
jgi:raffinose synthase